ncbi:hypothetical protein RPMD05_65 [Rhodobacteraceae phage LS06-2018-MD05]|nr:hypothetical protein RPMD05_65 [Rhodobacteraceae phage LS06-2018-MD05]
MTEFERMYKIIQEAMEVTPIDNYDILEQSFYIGSYFDDEENEYLRLDYPIEILN